MPESAISSLTERRGWRRGGGGGKCSFAARENPS